MANPISPAPMPAGGQALTPQAQPVAVPNQSTLTTLGAVGGLLALTGAAGAGAKAFGSKSGWATALALLGFAGATVVAIYVQSELTGPATGSAAGSSPTGPTPLPSGGIGQGSDARRARFATLR